MAGPSKIKLGAEWDGRSLSAASTDIAKAITEGVKTGVTDGLKGAFNGADFTSAANKFADSLEKAMSNLKIEDTLNLSEAFRGTHSAVDKIVGELGEVKDALNQINQAISHTPALFDMVGRGTVAIGQMVVKLQEVSELVDQLNNKEFSITQTIQNFNKASSGIDRNLFALQTKQAYALRDAVESMQNSLMKANSAVKDSMGSGGRSVLNSILQYELPKNMGTQTGVISAIESMNGVIRKGLEYIEAYNAQVDAIGNAKLSKLPEPNITGVREATEALNAYQEAASKVAEKASSTDSQTTTKIIDDAGLARVKELIAEIETMIGGVNEKINNAFDFSQPNTQASDLLETITKLSDSLSTVTEKLTKMQAVRFDAATKSQIASESNITKAINDQISGSYSTFVKNKNIDFGSQEVSELTERYSALVQMIGQVNAAHKTEGAVGSEVLDSLQQEANEIRQLISSLTQEGDARAKAAAEAERLAEKRKKAAEKAADEEAKAKRRASSSRSAEAEELSGIRLETQVTNLRSQFEALRRDHSGVYQQNQEDIDNYIIKMQEAGNVSQKEFLEMKLAFAQFNEEVKNSKPDEAIEKRVNSLRRSIEKILNGNEELAGSKQGEELRGIIEALNNTDIDVAGLDRIEKQIPNIVKGFSNAQGASYGFFGTLTEGVKNIAEFAVLQRMLSRVTAEIKKMVEAVKEIDSAMVELKKVTDLTSAGYKRFYEEAVGSSQKIGATVSDTINAAADFARLGYGVDDALKLGEAALVYKNVGDGINDVGTATESLISTIKAFGMEAGNAMTIVDEFNEIGNKFAISSTGIGEALVRSASALQGAGNTLEESIGLITASNAIIQNPESVGTALKTLTMYLRAAKPDLEAMGEDADDCANSVAELRDKLLTLTKVDIMKNAKEFKSTYQIVQEISKVWNTIPDVDKAAVTKLIGGKRNANIVQALLTNFSDAEAVVATAMNATGSAAKENEQYLDSIAGKLDLLKGKYQEISEAILGSDIVKTVVDVARYLLDIVGALGSIPAPLKVIAGMTVLMAESSSMLSKLPAVLTKAFSVITNVLNGSTSILGLISAHPIMAAVTGITAVISTIATYNKKLKEKREAEIQAADDAANAYKETSQTYEDNASKLKELSARYNELVKGVDENGERVSLTTGEYEEFRNVLDQIINITPSVVTGYDEQGRAVVDYANVVKDATEDLENFNKASKEVYYAGASDIVEGWKNKQEDGMNALASSDAGQFSLWEIFGTGLDSISDNDIELTEKELADKIIDALGEIGAITQEKVQQAKDDYQIFGGALFGSLLSPDEMIAVYDNLDKLEILLRGIGDENGALVFGFEESRKALQEEVDTYRLLSTTVNDAKEGERQYDELLTNYAKDLPILNSEFKDFEKSPFFEPLVNSISELFELTDGTDWYTDADTIANIAREISNIGTLDQLDDAIAAEYFNNKFWDRESSPLYNALVMIRDGYTEVSEASEEAAEHVADSGNLINRTLAGTADTIENYQNMQDLIEKAEKEMKKNGGISHTTLKSLIKALPEEDLNKYIYAENGKPQVNINTLQEFTDSILGIPVQELDKQVGQLEKLQDRLLGQAEELIGGLDDFEQSGGEPRNYLRDAIEAMFDTEGLEDIDYLWERQVKRGRDMVEKYGDAFDGSMDDIVTYWTQAWDLGNDGADQELAFNENVVFSITPIDKDGNTLSDSEIEQYINEYLNKYETAAEAYAADKSGDGKGILLHYTLVSGETDRDTARQMESAWAQQLHLLSAAYAATDKSQLGEDAQSLVSYFMGEVSKASADPEYTKTALENIYAPMLEMARRMAEDQASDIPWANNALEQLGALDDIIANGDQVGQMNALLDVMQLLIDLMNKAPSTDDPLGLKTMFEDLETTKSDAKGLLDALDKLNKGEVQDMTALAAQYPEIMNVPGGLDAKTVESQEAVILGVLESYQSKYEELINDRIQAAMGIIQETQVTPKNLPLIKQMFTYISNLTKLKGIKLSDTVGELSDFDKATESLKKIDGYINIVRQAAQGMKSGKLDLGFFQSLRDTLGQDKLDQLREALGGSLSITAENFGTFTEFMYSLITSEEEASEGAKEFGDSIQKSFDAASKGEDVKSTFDSITEAMSKAQSISDVIADSMDGIDYAFVQKVAGVFGDGWEKYFKWDANNNPVSFLREEAEKAARDGLVDAGAMDGLISLWNEYTAALITGADASKSKLEQLSEALSKVGDARSLLSEGTTPGASIAGMLDQLISFAENNKIDIGELITVDEGKLALNQARFEQYIREMTDPNEIARKYGLTKEKAVAISIELRGVAEAAESLDELNNAISKVSSASSLLSEIRSGNGDFFSMFQSAMQMAQETGKDVEAFFGNIDGELKWNEQTVIDYAYTWIDSLGSISGASDDTVAYMKRLMQSQLEVASASEVAEAALNRTNTALGAISKLDTNIGVAYDDFKSLIEISSEYARAIEYNNGRMTVNSQVYDEVTASVLEKNLADVEQLRNQKLLDSEYIKLNQALRDGSIDTQGKKRLNDLNAEIMALDVLETQIRDAAAAYQQFLNADSSVNADQYDAATQAYKVIQDTLYNKDSDVYGLVGREQYKKAREFLIRPEVDDTEARKTLDKFFKDAKTGTDNFVKALDDAELFDENGNLNASVNTIADTLGLTVDGVLALIAQVNQSMPEDKEWKVTFDYDEKDVDNLKSKTEEAQKAIEEISSGNIDIDSAEGQKALTDLESKVSEIVGELHDMQTYGADGLDLSDAETEVNQLLTSYNELNDNSKVEVDTSAAEDAVDALDEKINGIGSEIDNVSNHPMKISAQSAEATLGRVSAEIGKIILKLNQLNGQTFTFNVNQNGSVNIPSGGETTGAGNQSSVSGTGIRKGVSMAPGFIGAPGGKTLVGELGPETIVDPYTNTWYTVGNHGAEFIDMPKGAIVFNAEQTRRLLNRGSTPDRGTALASGNAALNVVGAEVVGKRTTGSRDDYKKRSSGKSNKSSKNASTSSSTEKAKKDVNDLMDWIEVAIARIERKISNLARTATSQFKLLSTRLKATDKEIKKVNDEIKIQQKGYKRYLKQANSVGLDSKLVDKVKNGTIDINEYDEDTQEKIKLYQQWYEKALACKDAAAELKETLAELYTGKFETIEEDFDNQLSGVEHRLATFENMVSMSDFTGAAKPFISMIDSEKEAIDINQRKLVDLQNAMNDAIANGTKVGSEAWYKMQQSIWAVEEDLQKSKINIVKTYKDMFDDVAQEFDAKVSLIEHTLNSLNNTVARSEYTGEAKPFDNMVGSYISKAETLSNELAGLENSLATAVANGIAVGSKTWNDMMTKINSTKEALESNALDISAVYVEAFNDIESKYGDIMSTVDSTLAYINSVNAASDYTGAAQNFGGMINSYLSGINVMEHELASLQESMQTALDSGMIKEGSSAWYGMRSAIDQLKTKIQDSENDIAKTYVEAFGEIETRYGNAISLAEQYSRQLDGMVSESVYSGIAKPFNEMIALERNNIGILKNELVDLESALQNATSNGIAEGSKDWYDMQSRVNAVRQSIQDSGIKISKLYTDIFDDIEDRYDRVVSFMGNITTRLKTGIDEIEARGYKGGIGLYAEMASIEQDNIERQKNELKELEGASANALNSGAIQEGSEAWFKMQSTIEAVKNNIQQSTIELINYGNAIRQIRWDMFDMVQENISDITDEASFLIKLMDSSDLFDERWQFTSTGQSQMGLHAMNYDVYMAQADKYADEVERLNQELAKDPHDTKMIARRRELLKLQRDSILAAEDEKGAVRDLVENGINKELESLKELIDAYTDSLDSAKDLYDYQKNIKDQTKEIASLQKQLAAYQGDTSEENRARLQQISVDLSDAMEKLQETQYDRYISDQKKLLDDLYNEYELVLNERLDNIDLLMNQMIADTNANARMIAETLASETQAVGASLSDNMMDIWNVGGAANTVVSEYQSNFNNQITTMSTTLGTAIGNVESGVRSLYAASDGIVNSLIADAGETRKVLSDVVSEHTATLERLVGSSDGNNLSTKVGNTEATVGQILEEVKGAGNIASDVSKAINEKIAEASKDTHTELEGIGGALTGADSYSAKINSGLEALNQTLGGIAQMIQKFAPDKDQANTTGASSGAQAVSSDTTIRPAKSVSFTPQPVATAQVETPKTQATPEPPKAKTVTKKVNKVEIVNGQWYLYEDPYGKKKTNAIVHKGEEYDFVEEKNSKTGIVYKGKTRYLNSKGAKRVTKTVTTTGYSEGGYIADLKKIAIRNGDDMLTFNTLKRGEAVLTPEQAQQFRELAQNLPELRASIDLSNQFRKINGDGLMLRGINVGGISVPINIEHVQDYNDFVRQLRDDKTFERMIQTMTLDPLVGKSTLSKKRFYS